MDEQNVKEYILRLEAKKNLSAYDQFQLLKRFGQTNWHLFNEDAKNLFRKAVNNYKRILEGKPTEKMTIN